jgi:phenylacetate-coenzyme A ligase PaaK-like adenylate-forming protein
VPGYDRWVQVSATGATSAGHYEQLVRRQRAQLQDTYMKGVRRLRWDAGRLAAERQRRLRELLVHAADRSPFWRERLPGRDLANFTEADLPSLPILTKAEMMEEFDRLVTVPGLTRARVQQHLDQLSVDGYLDDEYRAIITSGYVGSPSLHVYGWDAFVTFVMQGSRWTGRRGEDPDAVLAQCFSCSPKHESGIFYAFSTFESGGPTSHCFDATLPLDQIVDGLNNARPAVQALQGWPTLVRELALEAMQGRLTIEPTWVSVAGELCTPPVREAVRSAWGIEVSEFWGCSEGTYAFPCGVGEGMHIADDLVIFEPADTDGNVVPYGQPADRLLLTNLYNLDQPLIRYDLVDAVTMSDDPCPCGCAHRRITSVNGRINGAFEYEGGARVPRAAVEQAVVATPGVANFFVGKTQGGLDVSVVTDGSSDLQRLQTDLVDVLRRHGGPASDVSVHEVGSIERLSRGKCKQFDAR